MSDPENSFLQFFVERQNNFHFVTHFRKSGWQRTDYIGQSAGLNEWKASAAAIKIEAINNYLCV